MKTEKLDSLTLNDFSFNGFGYSKEVRLGSKVIALNLDSPSTDKVFLERQASRFGELVRGWHENLEKVSRLVKKRIREVTDCSVEITERSYDLVSFDFVQRNPKTVELRVSFRLLGLDAEVFASEAIVPRTILQLTGRVTWKNLDINFVNYD
jgi:hypothetical protein